MPKMSQLLKTIKILTEKLSSLAPIAEDRKRTLDKKFRLEFTYNSNHLEGNTLTYGETELLLLFDARRVVSPSTSKRMAFRYLVNLKHMSICNPVGIQHSELPLTSYCASSHYCAPIRLLARPRHNLCGIENILIIRRLRRYTSDRLIL